LRSSQIKLSGKQLAKLLEKFEREILMRLPFRSVPRCRLEGSRLHITLHHIIVWGSQRWSHLYIIVLYTIPHQYPRICAPDVYAVTSNCFTPSSARTYPIADADHPIDRSDTVVDVPTGEYLLAVKIFYYLPTVKFPVQSR
jgi:hypothetical protein